MKRTAEPSGGLKNLYYKEDSFPINEFPGDILNRITAFFSFYQDLFNFEQIVRTNRRYTERGWERLTKQEGFDFDCPLSADDQKWYLNRTRYLHGKVLSVYGNAKQKLMVPQGGQWILPNFQQVQQLFHRFHGVMECYPSSIGAFLWKDLNQMQRLNSSIHDKLFTGDFSVETTTGDLLLKGLSYLTEHPYVEELGDDQQKNLRRSAYGFLNQAIKKGATCASYLAFQILFPKYKEFDWYYNLILFSIAKEDYRGLERSLEIFPGMVQNIYDIGISYPPILAKLAKSKLKEKKYPESESLFNQAIKDYKDKVPAEVYLNMGNVKFFLGQLEENKGSLKGKEGYLKEADVYYAKAIEAYSQEGEEVPVDLYLNIGNVKVCLRGLGKESDFLEEIDDCYNKVIEACSKKNRKVSTAVYEQSGNIKFCLSKLKMEKGFLNELEDYLKKAEEYFAKVIEAYPQEGTKVPAKVYLDMGYTKFFLAKFKQENGLLNEVEGYCKESDKYCAKAMETYRQEGIDIFAILYVNIGHIKFHLSKLMEQKGSLQESEDYLKEVDNCYTKAIEIYPHEEKQIFDKDEKKVLYEVYVNMIIVKSKQGELKRGKGLLEEAENYMKELAIYKAIEVYLKEGKEVPDNLRTEQLRLCAKIRNS